MSITKYEEYRWGGSVAPLLDVTKSPVPKKPKTAEVKSKSTTLTLDDISMLLTSKPVQSASFNYIIQAQPSSAAINATLTVTKFAESDAVDRPKFVDVFAIGYSNVHAEWPTHDWGCLYQEEDFYRHRGNDGDFNYEDYSPVDAPPFDSIAWGEAQKPTKLGVVVQFRNNKLKYLKDPFSIDWLLYGPDADETETDIMRFWIAPLDIIEKKGFERCEEDAEEEQYQLSKKASAELVAGLEVGKVYPWAGTPEQKITSYPISDYIWATTAKDKYKIQVTLRNGGSFVRPSPAYFSWEIFNTGGDIMSYSIIPL